MCLDGLQTTWREMFLFVEIKNEISSCVVFSHQRQSFIKFAEAPSFGIFKKIPAFDRGRSCKMHAINTEKQRDSPKGLRCAHGCVKRPPLCSVNTNKLCWALWSGNQGLSLSYQFGRSRAARIQRGHRQRACIHSVAVLQQPLSNATSKNTISCPRCTYQVCTLRRSNAFVTTLEWHGRF